MTKDSTHSDRRPVRLLLIDDEKDFATVLAKRLQRRNCEVTMAFSGVEAIQSLREQAYEVAILDLKMEDMSGLEVLKILRIMDPSMPVIMLTGHGSMEAARQGSQLGAFDYLTKPCELKQLLEKINDARAFGRNG